MADAYKCDRCGSFEDGVPHWWEVTYNNTGNITRWQTIIQDQDLCNECSNELETIIERFFEGRGGRYPNKIAP